MHDYASGDYLATLHSAQPYVGFDDGQVVELRMNAPGFRIKGWYNRGGVLIDTDPVLLYPVHGEELLLVELEPEYNLTAIPMPTQGGAITGVTSPYLEGEIATITAVENPGWVFTGWSGDATGADFTTDVLMDSSKPVYATFRQVTNSVELDAHRPRTVAGAWGYEFPRAVISRVNPSDIPNAGIRRQSTNPAEWDPINLIELRLFRPPTFVTGPNVEFFLERTDPDLSVAAVNPTFNYLLGPGGPNSVQVAIPSTGLELWADALGDVDGNLSLRARRVSDGSPLSESSVHFYTFTSAAIVIGGFTMSTEDLVDDDGATMLQIGLDLRNDGYNVYNYSHLGVNAYGSGQAFDELITGMLRNGIVDVGIVGYSWG